MSTRAQIHVEGTGIFIYKHSDGYPDGEHGVLATLLPFVKFFSEHRGWDPEYLAAQIVREFGTIDKDWADAQPPEDEKSYGWHNHRRTLGWGLSLGIHGDEEFIYVVRPDFSVEVRVPAWISCDKPTLDMTSVERVVPLGD